eukprot:1073907-Pyramimonas_sp.AAC.1
MANPQKNNGFYAPIIQHVNPQMFLEWGLLLHVLRHLAVTEGRCNRRSRVPSHQIVCTLSVYNPLRQRVPFQSDVNFWVEKALFTKRTPRSIVHSIESTPSPEAPVDCLLNRPFVSAFCIAKRFWRELTARWRQYSTTIPPIQ